MPIHIKRISVLLLLLVFITLAVIYRDQFDFDAIQSFVDEAGAFAPLLFIAMYCLATVMFIPGSALTLLGGVLFGPLLGTFVNLTGATLGASCAFILSRYIASDWVEKKSAGRLKQLITGVENEGWRFIAFVRLVPLFPFNLLNYALGLTRIPLAQYVMTTFVFMLPGAAAYTWLGYAGKEAATGGEDVIKKLLLALALLAVVMFLPRFIKRLRETKHEDH